MRDATILQEQKGEDGLRKSPRLRPGLKNYIIDIDGVVCEDIPNEEPERMPLAAEIPGSRERIQRWSDEGNIITFFTARTESLRDVTERWLKAHGFPYHHLICGKPRGGSYHFIDDQPLEFTRFRGKF